MGMLFWKNSKKHIHLRSQSLLGRHAQCDIRIDAPKISGQHARLQWVEEGWEIRDLGSRNGTFVDGRRLEPGGRLAIDQGNIISLAGNAAEFEFVDATAPGAVAVDLQSGASWFSEGGLLALPRDQNPLATIFTNSAGEWFLEGSDAPRIVTHGETIDVEGSKYRIELPTPDTSTQESGIGIPTLDAVSLHFAVTPDEEQVEITVFIGRRAKRLPERRFHYLLVTLARAWIAEEGVPHSVRGWMDRDKLCQGLGLDLVKLGVEIYRARKQFATLGIQGAAGLIERRVGTCEIRIGVPNVQVLTL